MKKLFFLCFLSIMIFACERDKKDELPEGINKYKVYGSIQKGPFIQGSEVRIQKLNMDLEATGQTFFTETSDDFGSFESSSEIEEGYIDVATEGFYFNEVKGELSAASISLKGLSYLDEEKPLNINILTTLVYDRIKYLITDDGFSFEDARSKAQKEVLKIFLIELPDTVQFSFDELDISQSGLGNTILLAISSIMQYGNTEAQISELVKKISYDIKEDGILNGGDFLNEIKDNSKHVNVVEIMLNLRKRYNDLGLQISIPNFGNYIDKDGNGYIDLYQTPAPVLSPTPNTTTYDVPVLVTISCVEGADIYFTIDETDPDTTSIKYTEPFLVGENGEDVTVKAIAIAPGLQSSAVTSHKYNITFRPAFSPKYRTLAGTYNHDLSLELYTGQDNVEIFYTTDGSTPTANSNKYTTPFSITGNNTIFKIKAIGIHSYLPQSIFSSSYYKIDYGYDENEYIDTLTVAEVSQKLVGKWIGHVSTPWTQPYNLEIEIFSNGDFSAHSLSSTIFGHEEFRRGAFYGRSDEYSDFIEVYGLTANGKANAYISFGYVTDELKQIAFSNNFNNLKFEHWDDTYGPCNYDLTRVE